jgi:hypothetical protein
VEIILTVVWDLTQYIPANTVKPGRNGELSLAENLYSTEDKNFTSTCVKWNLSATEKFGLLPFRCRQVSLCDPHFEELCYKGKESFLFIRMILLLWEIRPEV